jgi:hypothetical protein
MPSGVLRWGARQASDCGRRGESLEVHHAWGKDRSIGSFAAFGARASIFSARASNLGRNSAILADSPSSG